MGTNRGKVSVTITDSQENSVTVTHWASLALLTGIGTEYSDYVVALRLVSAGAAEQDHWSNVFNTPTFNATDVSVQVEDQAELLFQGDDGSVVRHVIPAPKRSVFLSEDNETVDSANADVADLISKCLILLVTAGGKALVEYIRGYRKRQRPKAKKLGVDILNP